MKSLIKLGFGKLSYEGLLTLANAVEAGLTAAVATYPNPVNPTLVQLGNDITAYSDAIVAWGPKGDRGSHQDHVNLLATRDVLRKDLASLASYCENTTPYDRSALSLTGFPLRKVPGPIGKLDKVRNLRQSTSSKVAVGTIDLLWEKPLGSDGVKINAYVIFRGASNNFAQASFVGLASKAKFLDTNPGNGTVYYWVQAFNGQIGTLSDVLLALAKQAP